MNYFIIYENEPIGRMVELGADHGMGIISGRFVSLPAYERVCAVFRTFTAIQFSDATQEQEVRLRSHYRELDALRLSVTTAAGRPFPTISTHVEDCSVELGDDGYQGYFVVEPQPLFLPTGSFFDDARYWDGPHRWSVEDDEQSERAITFPTTEA